MNMKQIPNHGCFLCGAYSHIISYNKQPGTPRIYPEIYLFQMFPIPVNGVNQDGVNKDLAELKAAETKRKTVFEAMEFLGFAVRCHL